MPTDIVPMASGAFESGVIRQAIAQVEPAGVYMEIGAFRGGSLRTYGGAMDAGARLIAIDRPINKPGIAEDLDAAVDGLIAQGFDAVLIVGDSHDADIVKQAKAAAPVVDVLFIDGDHSTQGVNADVANYVPLVRSGGLVVFHDVGPCDWANGQSAPVVEACFAAWRSVAKGNKQKMIVQSNSGYGLVWID